MFMPRALADAIDKIARQSVGKDWAIYAALLDHWQEIVGLEYARVTVPVKVTFPHQPNESQRRGGTLCVRLPKGLTMEFTFKTEQIKQRINSYFGYDAITKIAFEPIYNATPEIVSSMDKPDPQILADITETAQTVEDNQLRLALENFGMAVAGRIKHGQY